MVNFILRIFSNISVSGFVTTCPEAVLPQYPTLLTPWRGAPSPCASCTCVPVRPITSVAVPTPCYAYLNVSPCEAGDRRTVQELQVPTFAVPKTLPKVVQGPQGRSELPGYLMRSSLLRTGVMRFIILSAFCWWFLQWHAMNFTY